MDSINQAISEMKPKSFQKAFRNERLLNGAGAIYFKDALVTVVPFELALLRLQDIHFRCLNLDGIFDIDTSMSVKEFQSLYRVAATSLICKILTAPPADRIEILETIISTVYKLGKSDGFESVFLTALIAASETENSATLDNYLKKWKEVGFPNVSGGNHRYSTVLDTSFRFITLQIESINQLSYGDSMDCIQRVRNEMSQVALSASQCRGTLQIAGMVVGGTAGGLIAGRGGAATGAGIGYAVGDAVANIVCSDQSDPSPDPSPSPSPSPSPDDDDDDIPEDNGCVANPRWGDFSISDPYSNRIESKTQNLSIAFGRGLNAFIVKNGRNQISLSGFPKLGLSSNGAIEISNSGFLRGSNFEEQLRNDLRRGSFNPRNKTNSVNRNINKRATDTVRLPVLPAIDESSLLNHQKLEGYRIVVNNQEYVITNEQGEQEIITEEVLEIHFQPGSKYAILFGTTYVDGDRAKKIVESGILKFYEQIRNNIDPSRHHF